MIASGVKFSGEKASEMIPDAMKLFSEHWNEINLYEDIPLDPDFELYKKLDEMKLIRVFTARDDGKLVGYCVYAVASDRQHKNTIQAVQDLLFITKEKRGFGMDFIKWCDDMLKKEGVEVVYQHSNKDHDFGPVLERIGYKFVCRVYARRLF